MRQTTLTGLPVKSPIKGKKGKQKSNNAGDADTSTQKAEELPVTLRCKVDFEYVLYRPPPVPCDMLQMEVVEEYINVPIKDDQDENIMTQIRRKVPHVAVCIDGNWYSLGRVDPNEKNCDRLIQLLRHYPSPSASLVTQGDGFTAYMEVKFDEEP